MTVPPNAPVTSLLIPFEMRLHHGGSVYLRRERTRLVLALSGPYPTTLTEAEAACLATLLHDAAEGRL